MTILHCGVEYPLHILLRGLTEEQEASLWVDADTYQQVWDRAVLLYPDRIGECLALANEHLAVDLILNKE